MALSALATYLVLLFFVGYYSIKKQMSSSDFIIGNRSLNFWLTALAAHASDMSSWLFLAYPAAVYLGGLSQISTALGLIVFMGLNWQLVAKKLRTQTEALSCQTLSTFFEKKIKDPSGKIRLFTAVFSVVFYTIYIEAGIYGIGLLSETLFNIPYTTGCLLGLGVIVPYVFFGGYTTLAWIDLFQGLFLLAVICIVPAIYFIKFPNLELNLTFTGSISTNIILFFGWGLGYFGQPHIVTKFMGIKKPSEINRSKLVGMSWMIISLSAATLIGLIGQSLYFQTLQDPQTLFLKLVTSAFTPFIAYFMLCAVIAATVNATSSQLLVLVSSLTEDIYHKFINKKASSTKLVKISRLGVLGVSSMSFLIAFFKISSIYNLVLYAWSGLGGTFGPLVLYCLFRKKPKKLAAWSALLTGATLTLVWPALAGLFNMVQEPLLPTFLCSFMAIVMAEFYKSKKSAAFS